MSYLRCCPFCGSSKVEIVGVHPQVRCADCEAMGPPKGTHQMVADSIWDEDARKAWNNAKRRPWASKGEQ